MLPMPAMWNSGTPMNPTSLLMSAPLVNRNVIAWPARLVWVSTAPFGLPRGAGGVHDQRGRVVRDVDRLGRVTVLGQQVVVAEHAFVGGAAGDDHCVEVRRRDRAPRWPPVASTASAIITLASQSLTRNAISGGVIRKLTGTAMAPSLLAARNDSTNSGAVEHQDQHPVAEADTAPAQRARECGHAAVEFTPRGGVAEEPKRRRVRLHQRMPGKLIGPVLPSREIRLIGRRRPNVVANATPWLSGQRLELPGCAALIFDQTCCCPGHTMASAVTGQPRRRTGGGVNAPARAVRRRRRQCAASRCPTRSPGTCGPPSCPGHCCRARSFGSTRRLRSSVSASLRCARRCALCAARAWCSSSRTGATSSRR